MAEEMKEKVRRLLQPTHDVAGWHAEVNTLIAEEAIPILHEIINDNLEAPRTRGQAVSMLGMFRNARAVELLIETIRATDGLLRAQAALSLGRIGMPEERVVTALIERLDDEDYFVRECCAKALGLMKRHEAIPALTLMSASDSVSTNREVAQKAIDAIRGVV
jgi:HEAT repeat protein